MKIMTYEPIIGSRVEDACRFAADMARANSCNVEFDFNDQRMVATPTTDPEVLASLYCSESERRRANYQASPEYKRRQEELTQQQLDRDERLTSALREAPEHMTLKDVDGWKKACDANKDRYGVGIMAFAERWARLMEGRMAKGERIADIADACSRLADNDGITGFMYGCAVSTLSHVWIHGEAL